MQHTGGYTDGNASVLLRDSTRIVGLDINFSDISYSVKASGKHILAKISGTAQKGSLLGIMGPSGSGKSTLMNILSGKLQATSGSTSLQGVEMSFSNTKKFKDLIGYVPQDDTVHPSLTVRENLLFSGHIRLGGVLNDGEIQRSVDNLIQDLGLTKVRDTVVGDQERRGVSGGERKRISIGLELIATPQVLILDEPTSGLDAQAALSIIMLLKALSRQGMTVICVLHQPRLEIFTSLDTLLLLGSGKQIYFGQRSKAEQYFKDIGYGFDPQLNPADIILDIVGGSPPFSSCTLSENVRDEKVALESLEAPQTISNLDSPRLEQLISLHDLHKKQISPWYWQMYLCFCRDLKYQSRDSRTLVLEVFGGILTGLVMGLALYEFHGNLYHGIFVPPYQLLSSAVNYTQVPQVGVLCLFAITFASAAPSVSIFSVERLIFRRESHSGHSESAYFMGKVVTSTLRSFLAAMHFTTCFMILAAPVISFGMLLSLNILYFYCIYGVGSIVAAVTKRENGPLVCLLITIVLGTFSGWAPRLAKVQEWNLGWFWYMCPGTWFNEAFLTGHTSPFSYLYDKDAVDAFTGFTTGRSGFDIGFVVMLVPDLVLVQ
ncbi:ATP-binding cassette sub-family G member [Lachnellula occidentalis]|uniref:ATP-binding cassette sub-family G member n=1 Tax=Lachnellula occidentalis TaxID=215460 RepID=A0A8H8RXB3_9HELO|nr:ATP-binding cassette sub-family G member [Lachnellula occidentalis]